ncbi:HAD family hydrolase [Butyrivibrio sp. FCS014]|uniref:HAD family hydrolase n=1 Tax=Butyrivibrio sp. FCS014 TaxID=1408304 RepID=UPI0009DEB672|nr:HAD family hydrolase [Butyrivibrio sp. FCS014]
MRESALETFAFFKKQNVNVKVISGDNALTVSEVAKNAGIDNADRYVDATTLMDEDIPHAVRKYTVFGRVTPDQKQKIVRALKADGHYRCHGREDGVNDILAMKDAGLLP